MKIPRAILASVLAAAASGGGYHLLKKYPVPGDGGWDYLVVDEAARRLFVSHGSQVEVLDVDSGAVVGRIPDTKGVHGIALDRDTGRGFISNGGADTVTMFDLKTLRVLGHVKTGKNPDAIMYDPFTRRVFVSNAGSDSATVIGAADGKVAGTIALGGGPEFVVSDGQGYVFQNLEDKSEMLKINARTLEIEARWPLAPCEAPSSLAIDRSNHRLFAGCRSKVMAVVDADSGKVITTLPIGDHVDATVYDSSRGLIFNSNGEGTISIIHQDSPDNYSLVETVKTQPGAKTMTQDPKTGLLYLSVAESKQSAERRRQVVPGTFTILVVGK